MDAMHIVAFFVAGDGNVNNCSLSMFANLHHAMKSRKCSWGSPNFDTSSMTEISTPPWESTGSRPPADIVQSSPALHRSSLAIHLRFGVLRRVYLPIERVFRLVQSINVVDTEHAGFQVRRHIRAAWNTSHIQNAFVEFRVAWVDSQQDSVRCLAAWRPAAPS